MDTGVSTLARHTRHPRDLSGELDGWKGKSRKKERDELYAVW